MENPNFFKYVVYGDSVCGLHKILFIFDKIKYEMTLDETWELLKRFSFKDVYYLTHVGDKEYIHFRTSTIFKIMTYVNNKIRWVVPRYFMRHRVNEDVVVLEISNNKFTYHGFLYVTKDHSLFNEKFEIKQPLDNDLKFLPKLRKRNFIEKIFNINNIELVHIENRYVLPYDGCVYDFEVDESHNFIVDDVIVHNTDSLYINIPSIKPENPEAAIEEAEKISVEINNLITEYIDNNVLKKFNVDKTNNRTSFKTELVAGSMLLLDIKKFYAYKPICNNGMAIENPKVEYKGIPVIRNDTSKFAQSLLRSMIEDVALNEESDINMKNLLKELYKEKFNELKKAIDSFDIKFIGTPGKWKSTEYKAEPYIMTSMRFYNSITKSETFKDGVSGYVVPIELQARIQIKNYLSRLENNKFYLTPDFDIDKINFIAFPYTFDKLKLLKILNEFNIKIPFNTLWEKSFSSTCERVSEIIKNS